MPFEKGHKRMGGRQKGTQNKSYLSLKFWFEMVSDNSKDLNSKEKIEIAFRAINVLAPKVPVLPTEPGDSVDNALRAQALLKSLESSPPQPINGNGLPIPPEGTNGSH